MNSYQRLKKENEILRQRLMLVCVAADSDAARTIIARVKADHRMEAAIWISTTELKNPGGTKFEGYLKSLC